MRSERVDNSPVYENISLSTISSPSSQEKGSITQLSEDHHALNEKSEAYTEYDGGIPPIGVSVKSTTELRARASPSVDSNSMSSAEKVKEVSSDNGTVYESFDEGTTQF